MSEQVYSVGHDRTRRIVWFAFWNVLSFAVMFGIFFAIRDVEWWDGAFRACFRFFYAHETLAVLAALTPFLASMLVGWGYAQRARRRRLRASQQAMLSSPVGEGRSS